MPQPSSTSSLLTREEAANFLGLSTQTLATWACCKRYGLPYLKIGRKVAYRRADLEKWLASRLVVDDPALSSGPQSTEGD